jgi:hypothetical protein
LNTSNGSWNTGCTSRRNACFSLAHRRDVLAAILDRPSVGSMKPSIIRASVVLPEPLSPGDRRHRRLAVRQRQRHVVERREADP